MADKNASPDAETLQAVWAEARDLVKKLEGSSVQRFAVSAGDCSIEIERGAPAPMITQSGSQVELPRTSGTFALGAAGFGASPEARAASGAFSGVMSAIDNRIAVLAPLVGTFYRSATPGGKAFADEGDVVEPGQTVCIVEAMKLMNEVGATEGGKIVEICVSDGDPVEFEQVLMYLEPAED
jgi:acetyl-CoA carboxylase biotin carboxyl carrier protein